MKCLCGYEKTEKNKKDNFIAINGYFTTTTQGNYQPDKTEELYLYACPNCGTVRVKSYLISQD